MTADIHRRTAKSVVLMMSILLSGCASMPVSQEVHNAELRLRCEQFTWSDVEQLAQPYLSDFLYTALVMQGQSSNYMVSEAAAQVLATADYLPESVKVILGALKDANC